MVARADGTRLAAIVNWRRVADAAGRLLGYRVTVTDASERAGLERELSRERERTRQQEAIVRQRSESGAFKDVEGLKKVPGLDVTVLQSRRDRITYQ